MKDRIAKYPNRIGLTDENGVKKYYTLSREDEPTEEGTKLNKASLLSDDTSARLGFENDATVDDALSVLASGGGYLFGDIQLSTNSYIGDEWLYCNGANVNANNYPKLVDKYGVTKPFMTDFPTINLEKIFKDSGYSNYSIWGFEYIDGEYVIYGLCGVTVNSNVQYYTFFLYSNDLLSTEWEMKLIKQQNAYYFNVIKYINNMFVAIYTFTVTTRTNQIYYLRDYKNATSWTVGMDITSLDNGIAPRNIAYGNGYYMISFFKSYNNNATPYIVQCDDITSSDISDFSLSYINNANIIPRHLDFIDGKFVISGFNGASSTYYSAVAWKQNKNDTWQVYQQTSTSPAYLGDVKVVQDSNGVMFALRLETHNLGIYNFDFERGIGSLIVSVPYVFNGTINNQLYGAYIDDEYIITSHYYSSYGLTFVVYDRKNNTFSKYGNKQFENNFPNTLFFTKIRHDFICILSNLQIGAFNDMQVTLPTISVDGTYVFIKAK